MGPIAQVVAGMTDQLLVVIQHPVHGLDQGSDFAGIAAIQAGGALGQLAQLGLQPSQGFEAVADLKRHRHLIVRDSSARKPGDANNATARDVVTPGSWINENRLTVSNKATSIRAAKMGLGYAWYPEDIVREEIAGGELKPLPLREGAERFATLYLVLTDPDAAGPGTRLLAGIIRDTVNRQCQLHKDSAGTGDDAGNGDGAIAEDGTRSKGEAGAVKRRAARNAPASARAKAKRRGARPR